MTDKDLSFNNEKHGGENTPSELPENDIPESLSESSFGRQTDEADDGGEGERENGQRPRGEYYPYGAENRRPNGEYYPYSDRNEGYSPDGKYYYRDGIAVSRKVPLRIRFMQFFYNRKVLDLTLLGTLTGCAILLFHLFSYILSSVLNNSPMLNRMYFSDELFKNLFGMLYTVICVVIPFSAVYFLLKKRGGVTLPLDAPKKGSGLPLILLGGMGLFYVGNVITTVMITTLSGMGIELYSYTSTVAQGTAVPDNIFTFLVMTVHSALLPAVAEEFAFRGVVMQPLRKYGDWFAVVVSAVLFGFLHGNMMQMPFAVIAGITLGYAVIVTGSMWTGIILHFLNNFMSLVYSIAGELVSDSSRAFFSAIYTYGIIAVGLIAFAGFTLYNPDFYRLRPAKVKGVGLKRTVGVYFLIPPMLAAVVMMLSSVIGDFYFA